MPSMLNEAVEWLDRAEQAREVAGQLTDPGAKQAVLQLAESYERLARTDANRARAQKRDFAPETSSDPRAELARADTRSPVGASGLSVPSAEAGRSTTPTAARPASGRRGQSG